MEKYTYYSPCGQRGKKRHKEELELFKTLLLRSHASAAGDSTATDSPPLALQLCLCELKRKTGFVNYYVRASHILLSTSSSLKRQFTVTRFAQETKTRLLQEKKKISLYSELY